ncbi:hypothetical protein LOAG_08022 [Loa loa]|uniref:Uncharacterized protein n=1 Tax=Loa loa TaxID=7209 RepID=A0A1I7VK17_LOALO|nr:hypothetical protein LOAG_08022 [Loa loa]EFO20468.1 hypothetical protein LOAG_08022 [Loa loa]
MSEYTSKSNNNNSSSNYNTGAFYHGYRDRSAFGDSLRGGTESDLTKSTWFSTATSSLENKYDHRIFPDGPMAMSFEKYVHNIFRPGNKLPKLSATSGNSISAQRMLRVHDLFGSAALNESFDEDIMKTPLEKMFNEYSLTGSADYLSYSSYYPTNSVNSTCNSTVLSPFQSKDGYAFYWRKVDDDWKRNNKQMIIDYKGSNNTPLTPYMYAEHPYVRSQDSRIVGSNFVQITSRPKDRFLEKIDQTLAEVRAMPRF